MKKFIQKCLEANQNETKESKKVEVHARKLSNDMENQIRLQEVKINNASHEVFIAKNKLEDAQLKLEQVKYSVDSTMQSIISAMTDEQNAQSNVEYKEELLKDEETRLKMLKELKAEMFGEGE